MTEWIQKQYVVAGIAAVCLVSMLVKCLIRHKYRAMLREVQDMGHSKHKLVKSMVMKFDACYKLKMGVPNVSLFVKKYLWHYRMMGLYMKTWENINGFCLVIVMAGKRYFCHDAGNVCGNCFFTAVSRCFCSRSFITHRIHSKYIESF